MIVTGDIPVGQAPSGQPGGILVASVDVEWSKNYRVKGGNVPFCFSVTWLSLSGGDAVTDATRFWFSSAYVESDGDLGDLVGAADSALGCIADHASLVTGHQLCSDLAVLASSAIGKPGGIEAARIAWRQRRRQADPGHPAWLDTRYDAGRVLTSPSRRLVDVCDDLRLDVTQPELRGTSMTALHRRWIDQGDTTAREKITVLNLRHSLSTALVAASAAGLAHWQPGLNVNRLLSRHLGSELAWTASPAFTALLGEPGAA
jgi:hypothetical protein